MAVTCGFLHQAQLLLLVSLGGAAADDRALQLGCAHPELQFRLYQLTQNTLADV